MHPLPTSGTALGLAAICEHQLNNDRTILITCAEWADMEAVGARALVRRSADSIRFRFVPQQESQVREYHFALTNAIH